jgi:uncharacterized protein YggE
MKTHKKLFSLLAFATTLALGQNNPAKLDEQPYIEVTGTAEQEIVPDEIYIGIVLREKYAGKVKLSIEEQEVKLKNAVKSLGIDLDNLYLSDVNADYVKIRWQKKDVLTKKEYTLKVSNATAVGQVFVELEKLEITDGFIAKVNHSKMDKWKKEVKIQAIQDAKEKAQYLLKAIGEQIGKPLVITEQEIPFYNRPLAKTAYAFDAETKASMPEDSDIQFQKIKIQTNIHVKFSIK